MLIILEFLIIVGLLYLIWLFLYSMLFGAPYAAIGKDRLAAMLHLADIKKGEKVVDLGAGDGRIVVAFAKAGAIAHGYEINPVLWIAAQFVMRKHAVKAKVSFQDLWKVDLSAYDVVTLYGNFPMMNRLEKKLQRELRPGARVISNHFRFPNWKFAKREKDVYLYIK